jgi:hypothetical protein
MTTAKKNSAIKRRYQIELPFSMKKVAYMNGRAAF